MAIAVATTSVEARFPSAIVLTGSDPVTKLLRDPLWLSGNACDAAHILMVPMHEAYQSKRELRIRAFRQFFHRAHKHRLDLAKGRGCSSFIWFRDT